MGFRSLDADVGLLYRDDDSGWSMWMTSSSWLAEVMSVIDELVSVFEAHDLGDAHLFLSISIERDRVNRTLKLSQKRLPFHFVEEHGVGDCKGKTVPLSISVQLTKADRELLDKETYTYTRLIGSLLYLFSQAVGALSK